MGSATRPTLLVTTSTFPRWEGDTEPRFVESISFELAKYFDVVVLAPHCRGAVREEVFSRGERTVQVRRYRYFLPALETLAYDGGILWRVRKNPFRLLLLPLFLLAQLASILRLHREFEFAAIHAHWIIPQGLVAATVRVWSRRSPPILITSHGGDLYALQGRRLGQVKAWILDKADAITVVSSAMREYCEERQFAPGRVVVQSMGVDLDSKFTPGDTGSARSGLVFVGRLVEKKGVAHLIEAMSMLVEQYPDLRLTIVGDGPLRPSLSALVRARGVTANVEFIGAVPNVEVPDFLRAARIAVMPSVVAASGDQEGLGLAAVEALGCGCAVVASDLPAIRDTIIDGQTGLMAQPANAGDIAEKVAVLLDDAVLCRNLAEAGRRHALAKFTWPAVGANYARIITKMVEDSALERRTTAETDNQ